MWKGLAHIVIRYRLPLMLLIVVTTAFMGYMARNLELSYSYVETVPRNDPDMRYYKNFRSQFGEDGNLLAIGVKDSSIYQVRNFNKFKDFSNKIAEIEGVKDVISIPLLQNLVKDTEEKKFTLEPVFKTIPSNQDTLDSLVKEAEKIRFFSDQILNKENGATLILIFLNKEVVNTSERHQLITSLQALGDEFTNDTQIQIHYAGLPFFRTIMSIKIREELNIFLILSVAITALFLLLFFRSWDAVLFPLIIIGIMVVWSLGTLALMGYQITVLTGLIPPIIVIIGIPNSIYLLNKYHQEYSSHGNKMLALSYIIRKIGVVTFLTNFTTAVGFLVLAATNISILKEFGVVAGINILATFFVSIIIIPSVFSYLPAPNSRRLKHLKFKMLNVTLHRLDLLVHRHKYSIFVVALGAVAVSLIGLSELRAISFLVDDIPKRSKVQKDLEFFERNFTGVLPLEIVVDTKKPKGVTRLQTLQKAGELQDYLAEQEYVSQPISIINFIKASRQAFYNGNPAYYELPNNRDRGFISRYLQGSKANIIPTENQSGDTLGPDNEYSFLSNFVDSTGQKMRISLKIANLSSDKLQDLVQNKIIPKSQEVFADSEIEATITGITPLFIKGNRFLINNLLMSMLLAFCIIAIIMGLLFGNIRMIFISLIPNIIPLLMTAGLMGFLGITLKPSTAIIFSIVFGISVDDSIHFLAKYRQEMKLCKFFVPVAISKSIRETGASMIYTSVVLFAGFIIFAGSSFGGTAYLGILTSITLLIAMLTNLTVLPALLMAFDHGRYYKDNKEGKASEFIPLIEHYDDFYQEDEDEEIDLEQISKKEIKSQPVDVEKNGGKPEV